jgi:hypothetical protein
MDGTEEYSIEQNKPDSERKIPRFYLHIWNPSSKKKKTT